MRNLILLSLLLIGCDAEVDKTICSKSYTTYMGDPMPINICRFYYNNFSRQFQDSCHLYYIGGTITFKRN